MSYRHGVHRLVVVILIAVLSGCAGGTSGVDSTVGVRASGCESIDRFGTGVVITGPDGPVVVTSAHTVTGASTITVVAGREQPAELLAFDPASDLALLSAPPAARPAPIARTIDTGDPARLVVWEPDGRFVETEVEIRRLLRVSIEDIFVESEVERLAFEIDVATTRGDSGAPVFDDEGGVLGIIYARSRERPASFAVCYEEITALMAAATIPPSASRCR